MDKEATDAARKARKVLIVTHPNGFFGRERFGWQGIDVTKLVRSLQSIGPVVVVPINRLLAQKLALNDIVIYSSSDEPNIRQYYKDVLFICGRRATLVPPYEYILAHENKGFQELHKADLEVGDLAGGYFFDLDEVGEPFPFVFKRITGAGSSGVSLVTNNSGLDRIRRRLFSTSSVRKLKTFIRKYSFVPSLREMYLYRHKGFGLGVFQEFVPALDRDYKVLIFWDRYFVLTRSVRKGDFRASGSGYFSHVDMPEPEVLNYARHIFEKLSVPYVSLDVVRKSDGACALIEYQAVHFGPITLMDSSGFFEFDNDEWRFVPQTSNLEDEMGRSLFANISNLEYAKEIN